MTQSEHDHLKNMFNVPMNLLTFLGLRPNHHKKSAYALCGIVQCLRLIIWFMVICSIYNHRNLESIVEAFNTVAEFCQGVPVYLYILYEQDINTMCEDLDKYWIDEDIKNISRIFCKIASLGLKCSFLIYYLANLVSLINQSLFFPVYIPKFRYGFYVAFVLELACLHYDILVFYTTVCFFVGMAIVLILQFRLLNKQFRNIGTENGLNSERLDLIKECVRSHKRLMENSTRLGSVYSIALLIQYFVSSLSVMSVMMIVTNSSDLSTIVSQILYLVAVICQLGLFCFASDELISEAENTSNAIYESLWYENIYFANTFVQPITVRAQKPVVISAGGLADMNRATFVQILKMAFSLYTFLNNVKAKNLEL